MPDLIRTDADHPALSDLIPQLDAYLAIVNGEADSFFTQHNKLIGIRHVVIAESDGHAVGCGAFKELDPTTVEIKRMFVKPEARGQKVGSSIVKELESWAAEAGYQSAVLETCKAMTDAVRLYERNGYAVIPNYGQYIGVETSVCMQKALKLGSNPGP